MLPAAPYTTLAEAGLALRQREVSAVELTRACLDRIEALDGRLHAFITVTPDRALRAARRQDADRRAGIERGPLQGIPVAVKDIFATRGVRTTCHSASLEAWIPEVDAAVVRRLATAGAIPLGKLGMHEFAFGGPTTDAPFPAVRNPWDVEHVPGGSSSGAGAAVAAGLCYGAVGSDTGGSIRAPAAHCGIVGLKPSRGRVSRYGQVPLSPSLDHAGPMARTVEDCALLLGAIAGHDRRDPASVRRPVPPPPLPQADLPALRIGVPRRGWFDDGLGIEPEVAAIFEGAMATLEALGARPVDLDGAPFALAGRAGKLILLAEAYAIHARTLREAPERLGRGFRRRVLPGAFLSAADYLAARRAGAMLAVRIADAVAGVDIIATPTLAVPAERFDGAPERDLRPNFTSPFNLGGLPALSIPCGFTRAGLPVGLQLIGPAFAEAALFRVAAAYEQATPWQARHPIP